MTTAPEPEVSLERQIACVRREVWLRGVVYPLRVGRGVMRQAKADGELACMQAVLLTLERLLAERRLEARARLERRER